MVTTVEILSRLASLEKKIEGKDCRISNELNHSLGSRTMFLPIIIIKPTVPFQVGMFKCYRVSI